MNDLNFSKNPTLPKRSGLFLNLVLLAGLLRAAVTPVHAQNPATYLFQIDASAVTGEWLPQFLALDGSNNVYMADTYYDRIDKFTSSGTFLTQWGGNGSGNGQFGIPQGIAVDSSNNVYVADADGRIDKFTSSGAYLTQWGSGGSGNGQFDGPQGIAVDGSNNIYVADTSNHRIQKFHSNGNYVTQWGSLGSGDGQFNFPEGVAVDSSNNVYVADTSNNRIEKFDSSGNYLTQWGAYGSGNGQLYGPEGIAVDSSNNVYVVDGGNARIEKFTGTGYYLTKWGSSGSGNGQFDSVSDIALDSAGNLIYVADYYNARIQVFVNNRTIVPPIFTNQPASLTVPAGVNVTFGFSVVGGLPFACQWSSNNVAVPGGTNATFTLTNVSLSDSGSTYSTLVTNSYGSALSSNAMLTVLPAVALTQPASSITTTSAVLNGSVTVGSDETVVWFEWGINTNYGNSADGATVLGNSGSNNISAAVSGLVDNVYHYRIDASNDLGIDYGNDQVFALGLAPTVRTLAVVNSQNETTLNASVNPGGLDTTVYFRWGATSSLLTNSTPTIDVGAGTNLLNVSGVITRLLPYAQYYYQALASNYLGQPGGATVTFLSAPFESAPLATWGSVAASADGAKLVAGAVSGSATGVFISTNRGATWLLCINGLPAEGVASSADGTRLIAGVFSGGPIFISTNSGATWTRATNAPGGNWNAVASSANGANLAAVSENAGVYTSTNSGVNWTHQTNGLTNSGLTYIASSSDGCKLVAAVGASGDGPIFTSTNFGGSWTQATNAPLARWYSVASSANGNTLLACAFFGGDVYLSTNAGATWTLSSLPTNNWNSVAESADGTKMVALANSGNATFGIGHGGIFTSTNSGATWVSNNVPSGAWTCAAMSADGNEFIAVIGYPSEAGGIYVSQTTPSPVLNLSASDNVLSWIIPSLDFTLQQSPDLLNWTNVTNVPVLNLTNLENQVALPWLGNSFFRLKH